MMEKVVKKKQWRKPTIKELSFKKTLSFGSPGTPEGWGYDAS